MKEVVVTCVFHIKTYSEPHRIAEAITDEVNSKIPLGPQDTFYVVQAEEINE
jgi:hypothetical protein